MKQALKYLPPVILLIEALYPLYVVFFTFSVYKNYFYLLYSIILLILAFFSYKSSHNRLIQWLTIIASLLWGLGGFLGLGWLLALVLAVIYILDHKNPPPSQINPQPSQQTNI